MTIIDEIELANDLRKQKQDDACLNQSWQITSADQREDMINGRKVQ